MKRTALAIVALIVVASVGCSTDATTGVAAQEEAATKPAAVVTAEIEVTPVDRAGYDALLARHAGKVILVDFWATWCGPCMQQLGHTAAIATQHEGLAVITVAMEDPEDADALKKALAARKATATTNLVSQAGGGSPAMAAFDISGGSLPHYKLYDRAGKLRQVIALDPSAEKQFTTDDVDAAVEELLGD